MQPVHTAWLVFLIPLLIVHAVWLWSTGLGVIDQCLPYWSGCVSISKAARSSDALFLFRAGMILNAALLIHFWLQVRQWLALYQVRTLALPILGITAALFLVLYANFLGTQGEFYQLLRRYGVTIYFAFTVLAQMLLVHRLLQLKIGAQLTQIKTGLCLWLLALGIISVLCNALLAGDAKDRWENIIEWHFALGMNSYFLLTALLWKKLDFHYRATQDKNQ
jgi:hypothetical protein